MVAPQISIPKTVDLRRRRGADVKGQVFLGLLGTALILAIAMVGAVLWSVSADAWDLITDRLWGFLTNPSSATPELAGVAQGIRGSVSPAVGGHDND